MRKALLVAAGLTVFGTSGVMAQANTCPNGTATTIGGISVPDRARATQDACQMAVDLFQFMAPQLGLALAGGNATLGQGSTLGGLGHFSIGVRGNVFSGDLPDVAAFPSPSTNGRTARVLPSKKQVLGLPTADAAIGIFAGIPLGLTNVGGIDALVSASYVPNVGSSTDDFSLTPKQNLQLGYGARVGLLAESIVVPGVSVTYIKRDLPETAMSGKSTNFDATISKAKVETAAWRLTASKSFLIFGVVVGAGQDKYKESASIQATAKNTAAGTQTSDVILLAQELTRTNIFADVSLNLPLFKIVGEVGQNSGSAGSITTFNSFSGGSAEQSRTYGSVGLRFGF